MPAERKPESEAEPSLSDASDPPTEPQGFDAGWLATGVLGSTLVQVVMTVSGFATSIIVARGTGAEGKGTVTLLLASLTLPAVIANPGLGRAVQVFLVADGARARPMVSIAITYAISVGSIGAGAVVLVREPFSNLFLEGTDGSLLWFVAPLFPASMLIQSMGQILVSADRVHARNVFQLLQAVTLLILVVVLVWITDFGVKGALVASTASAALVAIGMTSYLIRMYGFNLTWDRDLLRTLFGYGIRQHGSVVTTVITKRVEYFFLAGFLDLSAVGVYSVAAAMLDVALLMPRTIMELGIPAFATGDTSSAGRFAARVMRAVTSVSSLMVVPAFLLALVAIPAVFGNDFAEAAPLFGILIWTLVLFPTGPIALTYVSARRRPGSVTFVYAAAAIVNISLSLLLIMTFGLAGNAVATIIYYGCLTGGGMWLYLNLTGRGMALELVPRRGDLATIRALLARAIPRLRPRSNQPRNPTTSTDGSDKSLG